jgi:glycosyltransferase involved in cell wall biosynthesis/O-antigen/teichoic acid export membrane protein
VADRPDISDKHTFVVCAYGDSPHIESLFESLATQTVRSAVIVSTSTPTETLAEKASKYGYEVVIGRNDSGIAGDWHNAYALATTKYVTLAHQDDVYEPQFAELTVGRLEDAKNPILAYTDYYEIRGGDRVESNTLLSVKRLLSFPIGIFGASRFVRNRSLSFGDPICCPSVTYHKERYPDFSFDTSFKNSMDWDAMIRLAGERGEFVYLKGMLMGHRIHEESATTANIESGEREMEDLSLLKRYWPDAIAGFIMKRYSRALDSNKERATWNGESEAPAPGHPPEQNLRKDYVWNSIGTSVTSFISLFLLIVVTQLNGIDGAGVFSFCFNYAIVFFNVGFWGGRVYQVSDAKGEYASFDYIFMKVLTLALMFVSSAVFLMLGGYSREKAALFISLIAFKACEAFSDAVFGVIQRNNRLYTAGISLTIKGVLGFAAFFAIDIFTKDIVLASSSLVIVNILVILIYDVPHMLRLERVRRVKSISDSFASALKVMRSTVFVFFFMFCSSLIVNIPRYFIDIYHEDKQGYFGIVVMPATAVALFGVFILQPKLVSLTKAMDKEHHDYFEYEVKRLLLTAALTGVAMVLLAYFLGVIFLSFIYGIDLTAYRLEITLTVVAGIGGVIATIYANMLVIMRKLKIKVLIYGFTLGATIIVSQLLVSRYDVRGGIEAYLIANVILCLFYAVIYGVLFSNRRQSADARISRSQTGEFVPHASHMEDHPLISIIVPVYNGEAQLERCLGSVIGQSMPADYFEIILVDDGSTDGSAGIIDRYAALYPDTIRVFHRENRGVAVTRNFALGEAKGKYIAFLDQDDFFDRAYLEILYDEISEGGYDMVICGYRRPDTNGRVRRKQFIYDDEVSFYLLTAPWARMIDREFIARAGAEFWNNPVGEDSVFIAELLSSGGKIKCLPYIGYNWYYNRKSVSNTRQKVLDERQREAVAKLIDKLEEVFSEEGTDRDIAEWFILRTTSHYILNGAGKSSREMIEKAVDQLFGKIEKIYPNYRTDRYLKIKCPGEDAALRFAWHSFAKRGGGLPVMLSRYVSR